MSDYGQADVLVLVSNLSDVTTALQATRRFDAWRDDIKENPELWSTGWDLEIVRLTISEWAAWGGNSALFFLSNEGD